MISLFVFRDSNRNNVIEYMILQLDYESFYPTENFIT